MRAFCNEKREDKEYKEWKMSEIKAPLQLPLYLQYSLSFWIPPLENNRFQSD